VKGQSPFKTYSSPSPLTEVKPAGCPGGGRTPLFNILLFFEEGSMLKESQREAKPLLNIHSPFPLIRGRGIKGDGVTKKKTKGGEVDNV